MHVSVWAPGAKQVRVHTGPPEARAIADLEPRASSDRDGWWDGPRLDHGTDYAFEIDGRGPFPDPRSSRQPYGVHGFSRVFDSALFMWNDRAWKGRDARGALTYEMHVGTFTPQGTLDAAAGQLSDLAKLGIQMVELMPLAPFPGRHGWGYDGVSICAVHEGYGGPAALQRFVDKAHSKGIGVCLDVVYNHMGPSGNYLSQFGPYFTDAHHTPWGEAVNLDQAGSSEVRKYFIDNAVRWFDAFHVDALRLDAVHELKDSSDAHFLAALSLRVRGLSKDLGRPLSLIAESDLNDDRMVTPAVQGGLGMTAQWNDDVHHALHAYLTGERHGYYVDFGSIETLDKVYRDVFWHDGNFSTFRDRHWGRPISPERDRRQFVVSASNHDQVGNRALGDRPSTSLTPGAQAASLAFILLGPFTPMLFMGEEYGETRPFMFFTDHDDPELARSVSDGRAREFAGHGWDAVYGGPITVPDPQDPDTYRRSKLGAGLAAGGSVPELLREWFAHLIAARELHARAWERFPAGVSERADRVVTMHGPVAVHANLSPAPVVFDGVAPLAVFGDVTVTVAGCELAPDAVILEDLDGF